MAKIAKELNIKIHVSGRVHGSVGKRARSMNEFARVW